MSTRVLLIVLFFVVYVIHAQKDTIVYYPNGNMMHKSQILNGVLQGPYVGYYENGNLKAKGTLKNGSPEGVLEIYHENGLKAMEKTYQNGQEVAFRLFESLDDLFYLFRDYSNPDKIGVASKSSGQEVLPPIYDQIYKTNKEYYTLVQNGHQYGLMHQSGKLVLPVIYDAEIKNYTTDKPFPVAKNGKYGYLNAHGQEVLPFIYDDASDFSEKTFGYAIVKKDDKYGLIDLKGKTIIPFIYESIGYSGEGLMKVEANRKYGFIDRHGKVVVPLIYDRVGNFYEGLATVTINDTKNRYDSKHGYIDVTGKLVIPMIYVEASDFSNGRASVQLEKVTLTESEASSENRGSIIAEKIAQLSFYIDKTGRRVY